MFLSMINLLASFSIIASYAADLFKQKTKSIKQVNETCFIMKTARECHLPHEYNSSTVSQCGYAYCLAKSVRKIIENIDNAKHLVYISMSEINMNIITWALERARRRGVIVRVIVDRYKLKSLNAEGVTKLELAGIEVRFNGGVAIVMDNNFCLIDVLSNEPMFKKNLHPSEGVLINGTLYWTGDALANNFGNFVITSEERYKKSYKEVFDIMWAELRFHFPDDG